MSVTSFDFKTGMYASIKGFSYDDIGSTPACQVVNKFVINMRHVISLRVHTIFPPKMLRHAKPGMGAPHSSRFNMFKPCDDFCRN